MQPDMRTPDLVLDGAGYHLEHRAELDAWLSLRPYRGIHFPDLAQTRARLAETISPAPQRTLQPGTSHQLSMPFD